jgi:hypothetical protein
VTVVTGDVGGDRLLALAGDAVAATAQIEGVDGSLVPGGPTDQAQPRDGVTAKLALMLAAQEVLPAPTTLALPVPLPFGLTGPTDGPGASFGLWAALTELVAEYRVVGGRAEHLR